MPQFTRSLAAALATAASILTVAAAWVIASPAGAQCAMAAEQSIVVDGNANAAFLTAINTLRVSRGLNALVEDANLDQVAQNWSAQMASTGTISHRADLHAGVTSGRSVMGENVGTGPTVVDLMNAFIASPEHYANLIDPRFTHVGVGTVSVGGGVLFTTHEFSSTRVEATPTIEAPAPTTPPAPRPRPVVVPKPAPPTTLAPTTTIPPTTTTTVAAPVIEVTDASPSTPARAKSALCG